MPDLLDAALPEPYVWEAPRGEALSAQFRVRLLGAI